MTDGAIGDPSRVFTSILVVASVLFSAWLRFGELGNAQIEDLHQVFRAHQPVVSNQHDVFRFDISMHNPFGMRGGQGVRNLHRCAECFTDLRRMRNSELLPCNTYNPTSIV
jgi:hypothetical protein